MDLIRVGAFELYPSERKLCAAGRPVEVGARAFDLLLVLAEHRGRLVSKSTLLERVWPRVIVDENNIAAQIASLRRILGAKAIRTVPGFGYRLDLEVSAEEAQLDGGVATVPANVHEVPRLAILRDAWPHRLSSLIGRDAELLDIQDALTRSRLVTVVGAAGVGKTRLAQEILIREAQREALQVAWVSLASLVDVQHVPSAMALALGLSLSDGVDGFAALGHALEKVPLLVILDCTEHLGDALAAPLAALIARTQEARVLVTSQVPLGIAGETVYRIGELAVPSSQTPDELVEQYSAVALFTERAAAADRHFTLSRANLPLVAEICRRLDGNPLALELAAARVPALGLSALFARLDDRFRLLKSAGRSQDPRHGALLAAFEWSYELLTDAEQRVFRRLGAFAGSFSLDWAAGRDGASAVALFGSAWPLFVETDLFAEGRARYVQVLASLSDALPRARTGRFWEAIATYDSTRQCDRARYAAELAAKMHADANNFRAHYYALMLLASNWRVDTAQARAALDTARSLEEAAWPARLLTYGALTEGAFLTCAGEFVAARTAYQRAMELALTKSERQALAATVSIVELDIACSNTAAALQLGRPLAVSLRHLGRRDTRFELLVLTFSALLLAGEMAEARTTGAELYRLAQQLDTGKLYTVLDAMTYLACTDGRYDVAARIAVYADIAHEAQGQMRRRPAQERMRTAALASLEEHAGRAWRAGAADTRDSLDNAFACELALGLRS